MKDLTKNDILAYFEEINRYLKNENKYGNILIVGGAALALVYNARDSTHDVDAIFSPKEDMRKIIKNIADNNNLDDDWINDAASGFISPNMESTIIYEYSNLTVSSLSAESLLAMKLTSARLFSKDLDDSITLMKYLNIKDQNELFALINKYAYENQKTPKSMYFTMEVFEQYQKEIGFENIIKSNEIKNEQETFTIEEWKSEITKEFEKRNISMNEIEENIKNEMER